MRKIKEIEWEPDPWVETLIRIGNARMNLKIDASVRERKWSLNPILRRKGEIASKKEMRNPVTKITVIGKILDQAYRERYPFGIPPNMIVMYRHTMEKCLADVRLPETHATSKSKAEGIIRIPLRWVRETPILAYIRSGGKRAPMPELQEK